MQKKLFYFLVNNKDKYIFKVIIKDNKYILEDNTKEYFNLNQLLMDQKNKLINTLKNYDENTIIELYEYNLMKDQLIKLEENIISIDWTADLLKKTKKGLLLTESEISILKTYGINCNEYATLNDLLLELDEILQEETIEELEEILIRLEERKYYEQVAK